MKILVAGNCVPIEVILSKEDEIYSHIQEGYKNYLQPSVIVSNKANCWKLADSLGTSLCANLGHRRNVLVNEIYPPSQIGELIKEEAQKFEIILLVVHYKEKEQVLKLLKELGCSGKENFALLDKMDITINVVCYDQKQNICKVF